MDLVLAFDTDDPEFVRGFEAGVLWAALRSDEPCEATIHGTNAEMAMRMAEAAGRGFSGENLGDDWVAVSFH